jgi:hypothetical protein
MTKNPKSKPQSPPRNAEAKAVVEWAYRNLRQNKGEQFPFACQFQFQPARTVKLVTRDETTKLFSVAEIRERIEELKKLATDTGEQAEKISALDNPANANRLVESLGGVAKRANELLLQLARNGNQKAVEQLAFRALAVAGELAKLTRSNLELVKPIARRWGAWPVAYSPHRDSKHELEAMVEQLEVGHAAEENVRGKWSNKKTDYQPFKEILGTYAARIMYGVLHRAYDDTPALRDRLFAEVRGFFATLGENSKPLTKEEKRLLIERGWPAWIVDLVNLPPFSNATAKDWFEVGWAALKASAGGNVTTIEKLRPVGESRAKVWRDYDATPGQQENQRERQIHDRLLEAFLMRFKFDE